MPNENRDERARAAGRSLVELHFDGTGCGTNGPSGCSSCYGPSPMSAEEIALAVLTFDDERRQATAAAPPRLTPTQDLLVDVLLARHVCGDGFWTFDAPHRGTVRELEQLGLVSQMSPVTPGTVRARLTARALELYGPGER